MPIASANAGSTVLLSTNPHRSTSGRMLTAWVGSCGAAASSVPSSTPSADPLSATGRASPSSRDRPRQQPRGQQPDTPRPFPTRPTQRTLSRAPSQNCKQRAAAVGVHSTALAVAPYHWTTGIWSTSPFGRATHRTVLASTIRYSTSANRTWTPSPRQQGKADLLRLPARLRRVIFAGPTPWSIRWDRPDRGCSPCAEFDRGADQVDAASSPVELGGRRVDRRLRDLRDTG
jgi:hypothetical protein